MTGKLMLIGIGLLIGFYWGKDMAEKEAQKKITQGAPLPPVPESTGLTHPVSETIARAEMGDEAAASDLARMRAANTYGEAEQKAVILGGVIGLLLGLLYCYWKQINAVVQHKDLIGATADLGSAASNFWDQVRKV